MNCFCNLCIITLLLYLNLVYNVGIKTSEGNNDQQKIIHEPEFIHLINFIKTKELKRIHFSKFEREQLLLAYQNASINKKFNRKIQALKCTYAYVVYKMLSYLKLANSGQNNGILNDDKHFLDYQQTIELFAKSVGRMLSVLYIGKVVAANWLWTVFIKLTAINQNIIKFDELCNDSNVNGIIESYVNICIENNYINAKKNPLVLSEEHKVLNEIIILLMEAELVPGTDNILIRLYRYENQFNIYDFFWTRNYIHAQLIPRFKFFRHINWKAMDYTLSNIFNSVNLIWKHDIFLASQYFEGIKDTVSITIIYCVMRHIMIFQENRWSPTFLFWLSQNPNKTKQDINSFLKNILNPLEITLRIMNLRDDDFYRSIIFHLTSGEDINMAKFYQFFNSVKNKFENIFEKYRIPFESVYRYMESNVIKNMFKVNEQTLIYNSHMLQMYNYYFIDTITKINFKIITSFSSSEKVFWIDKFFFC